MDILQEKILHAPLYAEFVQVMLQKIQAQQLL